MENEVNIVNLEVAGDNIERDLYLPLVAVATDQ